MSGTTSSRPLKLMSPRLRSWCTICDIHVVPHFTGVTTITSVGLGANPMAFCLPSFVISFENFCFARCTARFVWADIDVIMIDIFENFEYCKQKTKHDKFLLKDFMSFEFPCMAWCKYHWTDITYLQQCLHHGICLEENTCSCHCLSLDSTHPRFVDGYNLYFQILSNYACGCKSLQIIKGAAC